MSVLETPKRLVTSRRFIRLLPWFSGVVLLAGIGTFLGVHYSNTAKVTNPNPTGAALRPVVPQKNIPFPPAAWQVAREFLFTAPPRKNLAESYAISNSDVRGGFTLKQWKTGVIPVVYFPTAQVLKYNWKNTNFAHPRDALVNVILIPPGSVHMKPLTAQIELKKVGTGSHARWLVSYFGPVAGPIVPRGT